MTSLIGIMVYVAFVAVIIIYGIYFYRSGVHDRDYGVLLFLKRRMGQVSYDRACLETRIYNDRLPSFLRSGRLNDFLRYRDINECYLAPDVDFDYMNLYKDYLYEITVRLAERERQIKQRIKEGKGGRLDTGKRKEGRP